MGTLPWTPADVGGWILLGGWILRRACSPYGVSLLALLRTVPMARHRVRPPGRTVGALVTAAPRRHTDLQYKVAPAAAHRIRSPDLVARVDIRTFFFPFVEDESRVSVVI